MRYKSSDVSIVVTRQVIFVNNKLDFEYIISVRSTCVNFEPSGAKREYLHLV